MSRWFRHYAGMCRDDKLVRVAIRSKQPIERVIWVWAAILESACEVNDNGRYDFDAGEASYFLRADEDDVRSVVDALESLGRLCQGAVVHWCDRQFSSDKSAERQRNYRERKKASHEHNGDGEVTSQSQPSDAPETETETETETERLEATPLVAVDPATPSGNVVAIDRKPNPERAQTIRRIGEWWNDTASLLALRQIDRIEGARETAALSRAKRLVEDFGTLDAGLSALEAKIRGSPFLQGKTGWRGCTFDWVMKAGNFQKIFEDNYDGEVRQAQRR